jgi:hypothetical protein
MAAGYLTYSTHLWHASTTATKGHARITDASMLQLYGHALSIAGLF